MSLLVLGLSHHRTPLTCSSGPQPTTLGHRLRAARPGARTSTRPSSSRRNRTEVYADTLTFHGAISDLEGVHRVD